MVFCCAILAPAIPAFAEEEQAETYGCEGPDTSSFFDACVNFAEAEKLGKEIKKLMKEAADSKQELKAFTATQVCGT
ncbi:hypothetical protein LP420_10725 [Massilia sp. B-10]|nr:hypothetical protein LP420_10725 [Massilia sp. B-10]